MSDHGFVPVYKRLVGFYKEKIIRQDYLPGQRIDSINRIIERHGVSRETAKLVLHKLSEEGIIVKKAGKGSFVTFTTNIEMVWGIVVPFFSTNIEDLISALHLEAKKKSREVRYFLHYNEPEEEMRLVGTMIRNGFEAIIVVPNYDESLTAGFYRNLNQNNSKIILVDNTMVGSFFNYVIQSYDLGVKRAFSYLASMNTRNLLFVKNETWKGRNLVIELMEQSLQLFISRETPERELLVISGIMEFSRDFLTKNNIGGILCHADIDSLRITSRLMSWGIIMPGEISVVSYGNTELTRLAHPPLTVIDCNYPAMAAYTSSLVFANKSRRETKQYVIEPELIVRGT